MVENNIKKIVKTRVLRWLMTGLSDHYFVLARVKIQEHWINKKKGNRTHEIMTIGCLNEVDVKQNY